MLFVRVFTFVVVAASTACALSQDWMFNQAPYTTDTKTGKRVEQYEKPVEPHPDSYEKFFNEDHPYIPYQYYWDEGSVPGNPAFDSMPYNGSQPGYPGFAPIGF